MADLSDHESSLQRATHENLAFLDSAYALAHEQLMQANGAVDGSQAELKPFTDEFKQIESSLEPRVDPERMLLVLGRNSSEIAPVMDEFPITKDPYEAGVTPSEEPGSGRTEAIQRSVENRLIPGNAALTEQALR